MVGVIYICHVSNETICIEAFPMQNQTQRTVKFEIQE